MLAILSWVVFGWIVGHVAQWFVPADKGTPGWQTIGVGIAGSVVGGMAEAILYGEGYRPSGVVFSVIGAAACMAGYRWLVAEGGK